MQRRLVAPIAILVGLLGLLPATVHGQAAPSGVIADQYIVVLQPGANSRAQAQAAATVLGVQVLHTYEHAIRGFAFKGSGQAAQALTRNPNTRFVSQDRPVRGAAQTLPTGVDRIDADLNDTAKIDGGDQRVNVNVAVLDTGIDAAHPDLNVGGGTNCSSGASFADSNGHGTHVAGIAGALDNGSGVVGVAPGARLWAARVLDDSGNGTWSTVICGVDWVTATRTDGDSSNDVAVANLSLTGSGTDDGNCGATNADALHQAICGSVARGVVYVAAAGNSDMDAANAVPAAYSEVLTVSAIADSDGKPGGLGPATGDGPDDTLADFSNWGPTVDIAAPGVDILSTAPGGGYARKSGTSMAAPHVAGVVALYVSANGGASDAVGVTAIRQTITDPTWGYSVAQSDPKGFTGDRGSSAEPLAYVGPRVHDGAVRGVTAPAEVPQGSTAIVGVTVANLGAYAESFSVTLRDTTAGADIGMQSVSNLASGASTTLSFTLATSTSTVVGGHALTATAGPVTGEASTSYNTGSTTVAIKGLLHVGDLDAISTKLAKGQWKASVTVAAHDAAHRPVAGAVASGTFRQGTWSLAVSCTTRATGTCTVDSGIFPTTAASASFAVDNVTQANYTYTPSANHDPDGDSNGKTTSIPK
jgi:subtilisin family serine protease